MADRTSISRDRGWLRFEVMMLLLGSYGGMFFLTRLAGWNMHPFAIFLLSLAVLVLVGVTPDVADWARKKFGKSSSESGPDA